MKLRDDRPKPAPEDEEESEADDLSIGERPRDELLHHIERLESSLESMRRQTELLVAALFRAVKVMLPFAVLGTMLLLIFFLYPDRFNEALTRMGSGLLLGKLSAIGGQEDFLFWLVVLGTVDVVVGLFLVWNIDVVYRIPGVGPRFRAFEARGSDLLKDHGWVRRMAFVGIVLVVIVPFQGTGAVMGSILGRLIGIGPWRTFAAIVIGAYTGVALILSGSAFVTVLTKLNPITGALAALALVGVAVFIWHRYFRDVERPDEGAEDAGTAGATSPGDDRPGPGAR